MRSGESRIILLSQPTKQQSEILRFAQHDKQHRMALGNA